MALLVACASAGPTKAPEPDPRATLAAYHAALTDGRPVDAYRLLAGEARDGLSEEAFVELYTLEREALVRQAGDWLEIVNAESPDERAWVNAGAVDAELKKTAEGWRLVAPVRHPPVAPTP